MILFDDYGLVLVFLVSITSLIKSTRKDSLFPATILILFSCFLRFIESFICTGFSLRANDFQEILFAKNKKNLGWLSGCY